MNSLRGGSDDFRSKWTLTTFGETLGTLASASFDESFLIFSAGVSGCELGLEDCLS